MATEESHELIGEGEISGGEVPLEVISDLRITPNSLHNVRSSVCKLDKLSKHKKKFKNIIFANTINFTARSISMLAVCFSTSFCLILTLLSCLKILLPPPIGSLVSPFQLFFLPPYLHLTPPPPPPQKKQTKNKKTVCLIISCIFLQAARDNRVKVVEAHISHFFRRSEVYKVNKLDLNGFAPIHYAAKFNRYDIMKKLVAGGEDVLDASDEDDMRSGIIILV